MVCEDRPGEERNHYGQGKDVTSLNIESSSCNENNGEGKDHGKVTEGCSNQNKPLPPCPNDEGQDERAPKCH